MKYRSRIGIYTLIAVITPLVLAFALALWLAGGQFKELLLRQAEDALQKAVLDSDSFFAQRLAEINLYARLPALQNGDFSGQRNFFIQELARHQGIYEKFVLANTNGEFITTSGGNPTQEMFHTTDNSRPDARRRTLLHRAYWQYLVAQNVNRDARSVVSRPVISLTTEIPQIVVAATILDDRHQVIGLVGGTLPWENIRAMLTNIQQSLSARFPSARFAMISSDGSYWHHWDTSKLVKIVEDDSGQPVRSATGEKKSVVGNILVEEDIQLRRIGNELLSGRNGGEKIPASQASPSRYLLYAPLPHSGYGMLLEVPESEVLSPIGPFYAVFIFAMLLAIVTGLVATLFFSRMLARPVKLLTRATQMMTESEGNIPSATQLLTQRQDEEIQQLASGLENLLNVISQRERALEQSQERFALAMQGSSDGLWDWDMQTNTVYFSPKWCNMLGYKEDELSPHLDTWRNLIFKEDEPAVERVLYEFINGQRKHFEVEYRMVHKRGHTIYVICRAMLVKNEDDKAIRLVGSHLDISDRKRFEQQMLRLNEELDLRVKERTHELENAYKAIKQERDRSEKSALSQGGFLADVSHDIRTPMNAIIGLVELCLKTPLNDVQHSYLSKLRSSANALLALLNNLLDYSEAEAGKLVLEDKSFDLYALLDQVADNISVQAESKGLEFLIQTQVDTPSQLRGDPLRLRQIILYLCTNAIKFTEQGEVVLKIQPTATHQNKVVLSISVRDTGVGIPLTVQKHLLNRLSSHSAHEQGFGLGLALCQQLLILMGSELNIRSTPGKGSTFEFLLNLKIDQPDQQHYERYKTLLNTLNILVVDDNPVARDICKEVFQHFGCHVTTVNSGREALNKLNNGSFDLIALDWNMPELDGFETLQAITQLNLPKKPEIVMITAHHDQQLRDKAKALGARYFMNKPIQNSVLFDILQEGFIAPSLASTEWVANDTKPRMRPET
ncbi:MAG: response regulator [Hahellaceae bacterium]|nr:response regulator [Hahellaceae bacterium]